MVEKKSFATKPKVTFKEFCENMDKGRYFDRDYSNAYLDHAIKKFEEDPYYLLNIENINGKITASGILVDDWLSRIQTGTGGFKNIIMSIEGDQGDWKSTLGLHCMMLFSKISGVESGIKTNIYGSYNDFLIGLENSPHGSTHLLDEQPQRIVSQGSMSKYNATIDFENIGRATGKNIIFASPRIKNHSHYYIFSYFDEERIVNPVCSKCPINSKVALKQGKPEKINREDCFRNKVSTNCSIPFYERSDYGKSFTFKLKTKNVFEPERFEVRGFVKFNFCLPSQLMIDYQEVKNRNIQRLEKEQFTEDTKMVERINRFYDLKKNELIDFNPISGKYSVPVMAVTKMGLKHFLATEGGIYTVSEFSDILSNIQALFKKEVIKLNYENSLKANV